MDSSAFRRKFWDLVIEEVSCGNTVACRLNMTSLRLREYTERSSMLAQGLILPPADVCCRVLPLADCDDVDAVDVDVLFDSLVGDFASVLSPINTVHALVP